MSETIAYLQAVVGADTTDFRNEMSRIRGQMLGIANDNPLQRLNQTAQAATYGFTVPFALMGATAVREFAKVEAEMQNINAIADLSQTELTELTDRTIEFGKATRSGTLEASRSLYTVVSAGIEDVDEAFEVMTHSARTAEAGLADIEVTTESVTAAILAYNDEMVDAERVSNALTRMVQVGVGSMDDFAGSLAYITPTAASLGIEIEELYGQMAFLTQRGFPASRAATSLNAALSSTIKPTEAMSAAFNELGADTMEDLIMQSGGLTNALEAIVGTTDGSMQEIAAMFNNIRGLRAVNTLTGDMGELNQMLTTFDENVEGATTRAWEKQMDSLAAQTDITRSAFMTLMQLIGRELEPVVRPVVEMFGELFLSMTEMEPQTLKLGMAVGTLAAALPPIVWAGTTVIGTLGAAAGAIAALGAVVVLNADRIKQAAVNLSAPFTDEIAQLTGIWDDAIDAIFPDDNPLTGQQPNWQPLNVNATELITIEEGDYLWNIWLEDFSDAYPTYEEWASRLQGDIDPYTIQTGDVLRFDSNSDTMRYVDANLETSISGLGDEIRNGIRSGAERTEPYSIAVHNFVEFEEPGSSFAERLRDTLTTAFAEATPIIRSVVEDSIDNAITWIRDEDNQQDMVDALTERVIDPVTSFFDNANDDEYAQSAADWAAGLLNTIVGAIVNVDSESPRTELQDELHAFVNSALTWLANDGIDGLSYITGNIAGNVFNLIVKGIDSAFQALTNWDGQGIGNFLGGVEEEFNAGFQDATSNYELAADWGTILAPFLSGLSGTIEQDETWERARQTLKEMVAGLLQIDMGGGAPDDPYFENPTDGVSIAAAGESLGAQFLMVVGDAFLGIEWDGIWEDVWNQAKASMLLKMGEMLQSVQTQIQESFEEVFRFNFEDDGDIEDMLGIPPEQQSRYEDHPRRRGASYAPSAERGYIVRHKLDYSPDTLSGLPSSVVRGHEGGSQANSAQSITIPVSVDFQMDTSVTQFMLRTAAAFTTGLGRVAVNLSVSMFVKSIENTLTNTVSTLGEGKTDVSVPLHEMADKIGDARVLVSTHLNRMFGDFTKSLTQIRSFIETNQTVVGLNTFSDTIEDVRGDANNKLYALTKTVEGGLKALRSTVDGLAPTAARAMMSVVEPFDAAAWEINNATAAMVWDVERLIGQLRQAIDEIQRYNSQTLVEHSPDSGGDDDYLPIPMSTTKATRGAGLTTTVEQRTQTVTQENHIHIRGDKSVDEILRELRRRGIKLK